MNKLSRNVIFVLFQLAVLLTSPTIAKAETEVIDDIVANTEWTLLGSPYIVNLPVNILAGATLSIDPGVVVKFESAGSFIVNGTLQSVGSSNNKIYFTSINDDSIGGDTNSNGQASLPEVSDWQGISFFDSNILSNLSNIEIRYAGFGIENFNSKLSIENSTFLNLDSGFVSFNGENNLKNLSISYVESVGISLFDNDSTIADGVFISDIKDSGSAVTIFENSSIKLDNSSFSGTPQNSGILVFEGSDLIVDHSIVSGFSNGIADYGSGGFGGDSINVKNSQIKNNNTGMVFYADDSSVKIATNSISNNSLFGAQLFSTLSLNLKNNFWGDVTGPYNEDSNATGLGNGVFYIPGYNKIQLTPWLISWPSEPLPCCSSVIFVPGFEGSRLYEKKNNGNLTQRWEAGIASLNDVKSLFMDENGNSVKDNIVTKDILEKTNYPINNVIAYEAISNWLRNNKISQTIQDFFLFPYDWRLDIENITKNGTSTDTGILKLKDEIINLAQNSKTGKVTLIGHSNGGLLIKKTIESLKQSNQANLIDKIIITASPQLGTPYALGSLLHGDDTSLGSGFVLDSKTARLWAQNMPGVYTLLPSEKLYQKIGPFIKFDSPLSTNWHDIYGDAIDYNEQEGFLIGGDGRKQPRDSDLKTPTLLRQALLDKSETIHDSIDNLEYPTNIEVYEVAGIGYYTRQSLTYKNSLFGLGGLDHESNSDISCNGDKTVLPESAVDSNNNPYYLDLYDYNKLGLGKFSHVNIMENPEILKLISNIITDSNESTPHITTTKPSMDKCRFKKIGMFSPADLDVYDNQGRHVGVNQEQSTNDFKIFDTDIPGSDFYMIGDQKFAILPDEGEYSIKIDGTGTGLYTLDITTQENDQVINETSFNDLPVTPSLKGSIILNTSSQDEPILSIDTDGNGTIDREVTPNNGVSPLSYLEVVRATILELELSKKLEKSLLQQIDIVIFLIKKNKIDKATDKLQKFLKRIDMGHKIAKEMTQAEREDLANKINNFLSSL